jgi:hypothetical protein
MNMFNDENKIIEYFQTDVSNSSVYFPVQTESAIKSFEAVHIEANWSKWTDSSSKTAPPPDFFCDEMRLMMEVMRVDDHSFENKNGKIVNPALSHESEMHKELQDSGILEVFPNVTNVISNGLTELPTKEDHNYGFYKKNFKRVISGHGGKLATYNANHPTFKLMFFVLDESSAYLQSDSEDIANGEILAGSQIEGHLHSFWADSYFVQIIRQSSADYVIWYAPYKLINTDDGMLSLPKACVYDVKALDMKTIEYNENLMVSSEI